MSSESQKPPHYIFISNSSLLSSQSTSPSSLLSHPNIQYHYLDDSPLTLLPQSPDEHVLVLDYDPTNASAPTVKSISNFLAATGVKVTDAPGVGFVQPEESNKNDKMYIIHASSIADPRPAIPEDISSPQCVLSKFKQRNVTLRRSLDNVDIQSSSKPSLSPQNPNSVSPSTPTGTHKF